MSGYSPAGCCRDTLEGITHDHDCHKEVRPRPLVKQSSRRRMRLGDAEGPLGRMAGPE